MALSNQILRRLLRPVVRLFLRRSHSFQEYVALSKEVFIEVAQEELQKSTDKLNSSRISALTGLHRYDIKKVLEERSHEELGSGSVVARVVSQWCQNKNFCTARGAGRVLTWQGDKSEFRDLVESVSQAINPGTVLFELERSQLIKKTPRGIKLIGEQVWTGPDVERGLMLLARDMDSLIQAVEENIEHPDAVPNLHIRTEYDNIYCNNLPAVRLWLAEQGRAFHQRARKFIAKFDKDVNPKPKNKLSAEAGAYVALGTFSITRMPDEARAKDAE